uniref:Carbonic anhydrase n=1 Tax=Echeneis naucrates TaxID=173247 RepID=A0A665XAK6_ECHNA
MWQQGNARSHEGTGQDLCPPVWHKNYPVAQGNRQSPIDIIPHQTSHDPGLGPITLNYDQCTSINITNNGHSVVVEFEDPDDRSVILGGPLDNPYRLKQFHFHWGGKGCHGSEHTVSGNSYASELHLVHWNAVKYKTFGEAATAPDGLAVLGIFLETGDDHRWLHMITDALYMVKFKGSVTDFKAFNPKCLLPSSLHYWTYLGSLTTPPLHESVIWIVLKEPIIVSEKQVHVACMFLLHLKAGELHVIRQLLKPFLLACVMLMALRALGVVMKDLFVAWMGWRYQLATGPTVCAFDPLLLIILMDG